MPIFSRVIFTVVCWSARRGLRDSVDTAPQRQNQEGQPDEKFERKEKACRTGLLGETYGYWYRRRQDICGLPELSVSYVKQSVLVRTAQRFLADRHLHDCPTRFDVLAVDNIPGRPQEIRLHKDAFSPQLRHAR
jgi:hypothetical protein